MTSRPATSQAIAARLAPAVAHRDALAREQRAIFEMISTYAVHEGPTSVSRVDRLRAQARERDVQRDLALAEAEVQEIERALSAAREAEREIRREEFRRVKAPLVAGLDRALETAALINKKLAAIEADESAEIGGVEGLAWFELADETPLAASRIAAWRRHAQAHGVLLLD